MGGGLCILAIAIGLEFIVLYDNSIYCSVLYCIVLAIICEVTSAHTSRIRCVARARPHAVAYFCCVALIDIAVYLFLDVVLLITCLRYNLYVCVFTCLYALLV